MHEQSLVRALLRQAAASCREAGGGRIVEIRISTGPLSGVEPLLLQSAFALLAPETIGDEAELVIQEAPLTAACRECDAAFELPDFQFRCPHCGSRQVRVTGGDEVQLLDMQVCQPFSTAGAAP